MSECLSNFYFHGKTSMIPFPVGISLKIQANEERSGGNSYYGQINLLHPTTEFIHLVWIVNIERKLELPASVLILVVAVDHTPLRRNG